MMLPMLILALKYHCFTYCITITRILFDQSSVNPRTLLLHLFPMSSVIEKTRHKYGGGNRQYHLLNGSSQTSLPHRVVEKSFMSNKDVI